MQNEIKNQHYIPRTYLCGFKSSIRNKNHHTIYQYNKSNCKKFDYPFSIEDVAKEKYFYEFYNEKNEIVNINLIERFLSKYEKDFTKYKWKMLQGLKNKTKCSSIERAYWVDYMVLQLIRTPLAFNVTKSMINKENLSQREIKNLSLYVHFPVLHENGEDSSLFTHIKEILNSMHFFIVYAPHDDDFLITSDNPICVVENRNFGKPNENNPFEVIYFPVCSKYGLYLALKNSDIVNLACLNESTLLKSNNNIIYLNSLIYQEADKYVFSDRLLSDSYIEQLKNYKFTVYT